jgi:regulator of sigma E protease
VLDVLTNLLAFVVAISVLVAVHEFGHYIVGRWCGMKVLRFSIGFGKPLWTKIAGKDKTEYCIASLPIGGYVKFLDGRDGEVPDEDQGRAFNQRPIPARIAVLLAGPMFNFLFAVIAYFVLFTNGIPTMRPVIGEVAPGGYAAEAELYFGDRIIAVGERQTDDWESALVAMIDELVDDGRIDLTVIDEDGKEHKTQISVPGDTEPLTEPGFLFEGLGFVPWQPPAIVGGLGENGAALEAGIEIGDKIVRIDGELVNNFNDLRRIVAERPDQKVVVKVLRGDSEIDFNVTLQSVESGDTRAGLLGISVANDANEYWYVRKFGPIAALREGISSTWSLTRFTVSMLASMATGDVSSKNISGPINIAQFAGDSAAAGFSFFLEFLIKISISLGIINLLPVPLLDGGQIVFQTIEWVKGSPLSERIQLAGQQIGIFALLLLMTFAFYNDIARLVN